MPTAAKTQSDRRRRRALATRCRQARQPHKLRLIAHLSARHAYAQIIGGDARVRVAASTAEKEMRQSSPRGGNVEAAAAVGRRVAAKALEAGIETVVFDRSGFRYHGRVKAMADAARAAGLRI